MSIPNIPSTYQYSGLNSGARPGANGWKVQFDSTKTINQYEYYCTVGENKGNWTQNLSISAGRKGNEVVPLSIASGNNSGSMNQILSTFQSGITTREHNPHACAKAITSTYCPR